MVKVPLFLKQLANLNDGMTCLSTEMINTPTKWERFLANGIRIFVLSNMN